MSDRSLRFAWRTLTPLAKLICKASFDFDGEYLPELDGPSLILANHATNLDPVLVGSRFKTPMYFVSSEHALRKGLPSWLLKKIFAPISRTKGSTDAAAARSILATLKRGMSVMLFPEGSRTFTGRTMEIHPTIARLARMSGVRLINYRMEGGYLSTPRWSEHKRKGQIRGFVAGIHEPEELRAMSPADIKAMIDSELHEDAFATQHKHMTPFKGKRLAEGLECALYICPKCGRAGGMTSNGNVLSCECGMHVTIDEYGFFSGNAPFDNAADWGAWQKTQLERMILEAGGKAIYEDADQELYSIIEHKARLIGTGVLSMDESSLHIADRSYPIRDIELEVIARETLIFSYAGTSYEIHSDARRSALKYLDMYKYISERKEQNASQSE